MVRTVFIDTDVISSQLNSLPTNRFSFGYLCGQSTRSEKDFIHYIIDGITSNQNDLDAILDSKTINEELWAKIIEITSSLCAGVSIVGFYCRAKADVLKSPNFMLKVRKLFQILQTALQTYSPWSLSQSTHRILLQSELSTGASKWLVKTMDLNSENVHFRPVEMKTFDSKTSQNWCLSTTIPIQFHVWLDQLDMKQDKNIKIIESQFEEQWKQYTDHLKESLLLMNNRLISMETIKLPPKTTESSIDIQWLSPLDGISSDYSSNQNRRCFKFDGNVAIRFFTSHSDLTGNDLRQYFIEDLFRSILIRLNLALINSENENISKLILPRRIYANQPVFIAAYQLAHEKLSAALESMQENFKINSLAEEDLEAAEQFPPEITNDQRAENFNLNNSNDDFDQTKTLVNNKSFYQQIIQTLDTYLGHGNTVLVSLLVVVVALLITIMLRLFS